MAVWKRKEEDKALEKGGIERGRQEDAELVRNG
jgi:hypothetical protein